MKKAILLDAGGVLLDETDYEKVTAKIIINILKPTFRQYQIGIMSNFNQS
jgi:FMN phosphatase YigB (HAD superfamily)